MEKLREILNRLDSKKIILLICAYYILMNFWTLFISLNLFITPYLKVIVLVIPVAVFGYTLYKKDYTDTTLKIPSLLLILFVLYFVFLHQFMSTNNNPTKFGPFTFAYLSIEMVYLFPAIVYLFLFESSTQVKFLLSKIFKLTVIFMVSNYIISIILLLVIDPNLSRDLATGIYSNPLLPVSTFDIVYASVLSTIFIFHLALNREWKDKRLNALLVLSCIFILFAGFLISIVLLTFGILLVLLTKTTTKQKKIALSILLVLICLTVFTNVIDNFFLFLSNSIRNKTVASKFLDISNFLRTGEIGYSIGERLKVYREPIEAIKNSFGLGIFYFDSAAKVSNHSTILYTIATTGIFGIVLFGFAMYKYFEYYFRKIRSRESRYVWIIIWVVFILMMLLNPVFSRPTIFLVIMLYIPFYLMKE